MCGWQACVRPQNRTISSFHPFLSIYEPQTNSVVHGTRTLPLSADCNAAIASARCSSRPPYKTALAASSLQGWHITRTTRHQQHPHQHEHGRWHIVGL